MAVYKDIHFNITERVARITLARPPLNILTIAMMREITDAIQQVGTSREVCAVVFAASPTTRAFSGGVSVEEHRPETVFQMLEAFHSIFRTLDIVSKPVVAIVAGAALGGGCELVAFADIVIASQSARFGQPEIKIGVFPPVSCVALPRVIGEKKAREMIFTGELLTAEQAHDLGLAYYVVSENELESKADSVLGMLRQMSVPALELSRRALIDATGLPFEDALKRSEDIYLNQLMSYRDPSEGVQAFIDKRPPSWKHK
jgi:cyclohexa-1,5-dienecarbonyl-CoA hydratase